MRALALCLLAAGLVAAQPTPAFLPIPANLIQWHSDTPAPSQGGVTGRVQVWLIVDWTGGEGRTGQGSFWSGRYHFYNTRTGDQRQLNVGIVCNDGPPGKDKDKELPYATGAANNGGLINALVGAADGCLIVTGPDGRVERIARFSGDFAQTMNQLEKQLEPAAPFLGAKGEIMPGGWAEAMVRYKRGDARGALAFAAKKLPDGKDFAAKLIASADAALAADARTLADTSVAPATRFLARERLSRLIEEFPQAKSAPEAAKTLKAVAKDKDLTGEAAAWAAFADYLDKASKQPPAKLPVFQKQYLDGLIARFPNTYGASLAGMVKLAAKID